MSDDIYALPIDTSNIRLYVIRISERILILGNGDVKNTKSNNEDTVLNNIVKGLQRADFLIKTKIKNGIIQIKDKQILGHLKFDY
jgi:hypothetical protein